MKYVLTIQPRALTDIQSHFLYLHERSPQAATKWLNLMHKAILDLVDHADWHPLAPEAVEIKRPIRQILVGKRQFKHRIMYIIQKQEVHVLHVRHGMKKPLDLDDPTF